MKRWLALLFILLTCIIIVVYETRASERLYFLPEPLGGVKVVVDAGHGGIDGGASKGEVIEKDITLQITKLVEKELKRLGAEVVLTRSTDNDVVGEKKPDVEYSSLRERKREDIFLRQSIIDEEEPDLFITIHANAIPNSKWRGAQVFYHKKGHAESPMLAKAIQESIKVELENTDREALGIERIYLLKKSEVPTALVETGFLSNDEERMLLTDDKYQKKMAKAIVSGIENFIHNDVK